MSVRVGVEQKNWEKTQLENVTANFCSALKVILKRLGFMQMIGKHEIIYLGVNQGKSVISRDNPGGQYTRIIPRVWSPDQQHGHHLGTGQRCKVRSPTQGQVNQKVGLGSAGCLHSPQGEASR